VLKLQKKIRRHKDKLHFHFTGKKRMDTRKRMQNSDKEMKVKKERRASGGN